MFILYDFILSKNENKNFQKMAQIWYLQNDLMWGILLDKYSYASL